MDSVRQKKIYVATGIIDLHGLKAQNSMYLCFCSICGFSLSHCGKSNFEKVRRFQVILKGVLCWVQWVLLGT